MQGAQSSEAHLERGAGRADCCQRLQADGSGSAAQAVQERPTCRVDGAEQVLARCPVVAAQRRG